MSVFDDINLNARTFDQEPVKGFIWRHEWSLTRLSGTDDDHQKLLVSISGVWMYTCAHLIKFVHYCGFILDLHAQNDTDRFTAGHKKLCQKIRPKNI